MNEYFVIPLAILAFALMIGISLHGWPTIIKIDNHHYKNTDKNDITRKN